MERVLILIIVAGSLFFLLRKYSRTLKGQDGCPGCDSSKNSCCSSPKDDEGSQD